MLKCKSGDIITGLGGVNVDEAFQWRGFMRGGDTLLTEEKDDEKSFEKKRRNLMVLCTIILIYELGHGKIGNLSISGGSITLEKPEVAIYFTWLAFVYFLWRFWQAAQPKHREIKNAFGNHLKYDHHFMILVFKYYDELKKNSKIKLNTSSFSRKQDLVNLDDVVQYLPPEKIMSHIARVEHTQTPFGRILNFGKIDTMSLIGVLENQKDGWTLNENDELFVKIPFFNIFIIQLKVAFLTLVKHLSFSEVYLPYLYWLFTAWVILRDKIHITL